jgi:NAD(P)-dependent dehydrogenase (short-subunit alcohol dehydrogenase family)
MKNIQNFLKQTISLADKVAIITGAASGIGRATANLLALAGAKVALIDIDKTAGYQAEAQITASGGNAKFYHCDVTSGADCQHTVKAICEDCARIDILFNNAGVIYRKSILELEEKEWDMVVNVSLKAIFLLSRHVIPIMEKHGGGSIINTGSGWGLKGGAKAAAYCAAKGGVVNLTRAMAIDHGRQGIRVNCICPGDIDTPLLRSEAAQMGVSEAEFMKASAARPINRVGLPDDVAKAVLFLAGNLSTWVTGTSIVVDGGGLA